jgi:iron(III) transport system permease protein
LGLGLLWLFLENSVLRMLYGTLAALLVAVLITSLTTSVQVIKSNFAQLGSELEEAARASGGSWWYAFRTVLVPLLAPSLLLVGALGFIAAARDISTVVLLATNTTRPLSILQLDFMVDGRYESASVIGVIIMLMTVGVALIARLLGLRIGVNQSGSD